jgi:hypothetical protein
MTGIKRGRPRKEFDLTRLMELVDAGHTRAEIAQAFDVSYQTLARVVRENGIDVSYGGDNYARLVASTSSRATDMAAMYKGGKTLQEIGDLYGVTRERVRQLISKHTPVTAADGGQSVLTRRARATASVRKEQKYLAKYGATPAQMAEVRSIAREMIGRGASFYVTPTGAFNQQRSSARARGIEWEMTFWQWWTAWRESGKWEERGRSGDSYVMCRFRDQGAYAVGNVYIATLRHNSTLQLNNPSRRSHPKHGEWRANVALAPRPRTYKQRDLPRGVTSLRDRYMAQIGVNGKTKYLGCFKTPDEASRAYESALASLTFQEAAE